MTTEGKGDYYEKNDCCFDDNAFAVRFAFTYGNIC